MHSTVYIFFCQNMPSNIMPKKFLRFVIEWNFFFTLTLSMVRTEKLFSSILSREIVNKD